MPGVSPQPGFQETAVDFPADVRIIGGSAGCGKSFCLLLEPLKYILDPTPKYNAIIFRRESVQISTSGGLWDKSFELYTQLRRRFRPRASIGRYKYKFPHNTSIQLAHLHEEATVYSYQGAEICYIGFDELTHFTEKQFFYMLSRNRSLCGVEPYVIATTNPQGEGWVKRLISWWLYPDDYPNEALRALPIPERQGEIRYFARVSEQLYMAGTKQEVLSLLPEEVAAELPEDSIRSITFIAGRITDNQVLIQTNPGYLGNLMALPENERVKLMDGRWIDLEDNGNRLYSNSAIADIFSNTFVPGGERYITADIALEGADKFIIGVWDGWVLKEIRTFDKTLGKAVIEEIRKAAKEWRVPTRNIAYDSGGVGGFLKGWFRTAYAFVGNATPIPEHRPTKVHGKVTDRPQYFNLRSQAFFLLQDKIEECELYIESVEQETQILIERQLRVIEKMDTTTGKLRVIPKALMVEKLGHSPDYADMISMRTVFDILPRRKPKQRPVH